MGRGVTVLILQEVQFEREEGEYSESNKENFHFISGLYAGFFSLQH